MNPESSRCVGTRKYPGTPLRCGQFLVVDIQFDESFRMLRDERDRHDQHRRFVAPGLSDFGVGTGRDPLLRRCTRLVANLPVEIVAPPCRDQRSDGLFDLVLIGIAAAHDRFRQPMRGKQNTQRNRRIERRARRFISSLHDRQRRRDERRDRSGNNISPTSAPPGPPERRPPARRSANCRSWSLNTADKAAADTTSSGCQALTARAVARLNGCQ